MDNNQRCKEVAYILRIMGHMSVSFEVFEAGGVSDECLNNNGTTYMVCIESYIYGHRMMLKKKN